MDQETYRYSGARPHQRAKVPTMTAARGRCQKDLSALQQRLLVALLIVYGGILHSEPRIGVFLQMVLEEHQVNRGKASGPKYHRQG